MGTYIYLSISKGLTQDEWLPVYEEALKLAKSLPLAEAKTVPVNGIETYCLIPCEEREFDYGWGETETGWRADSDLPTRLGGESFFLDRYMFKGKKPVENAVDPMYPGICWKLGKTIDKSIPKHVKQVWDAKTTGDVFHMCILAIGCLIADRLKDKVYLQGDIRPYQFRDAVVLVDVYLKQKIELPDQCVKEHLLKRIKKMSLDHSEELLAFMYIYEGPADQALGEFIRSEFTEEECEKYWRQQFLQYDRMTGDFDITMRRYLNMGFDFEKMLGYVNVLENEKDSYYRSFIRSLLETEIYAKDSSDILCSDSPDMKSSALIARLTKFLQNDKQHRWAGQKISAAAFVEILERKLGQDCDVEGIIGEWLDDTQDNEFSDPLDNAVTMTRLYEKKYNIVYSDQLLTYKKGNSIEPGLQEKLLEFTDRWIQLSEDDQCTELMEKTPEERCRWLAERSRSALLTRKEWEAVYDDVCSHKESFRRYYAMVRMYIRIRFDKLFIVAMAVNDDFYEEMITLCKNTPHQKAEYL